MRAYTLAPSLMHIHTHTCITQLRWNGEWMVCMRHAHKTYHAYAQFDTRESGSTHTRSTYMYVSTLALWEAT